MRHLAVAFCLLLATACDEKSATGPTVSLSERFTLAAGEVALVDGTGTRIEFVRVSGDSRCPADAFCIQGGDALVHVRLFDGGTPADYELHTGDSRRAIAVHRSLRIELLELQPYPFSSRTIAPEDYRATFVVTRP